MFDVISKQLAKICIKPSLKIIKKIYQIFDDFLHHSHIQAFAQSGCMSQNWLFQSIHHFLCTCMNYIFSMALNKNLVDIGSTKYVCT